MSESGMARDSGEVRDVSPDTESVLEKDVRRIETHLVAIVGLVILSLVGIGVTDFAPQKSHWYWLAMAPLFALGCIAIEWSQRESRGKSGLSIVRNQVVSWLGVLVAVNLVYFLFRAGRLDSENTGLVVLLVLALGTFLCGLNLDWRLSLLGAFLALAMILATYVEEYLWVLLIVPLILGGLFAAWKVRRRKKRRSKG